RRDTPRTHTIKPISHPLHRSHRMTPEDHQQSHEIVLRARDRDFVLGGKAYAGGLEELAQDFGIDVELIHLRSR
ncbi:hypothetical protein ABZV24_41895, partial [Streptomyces sp. NPDC005251]|uniref:hypothetical protein n=1 Tax=Streptomyces sp. NPDC005251 TaxID=3157166 RepID=UPI0033AA079C